jgi:hypothetical protein
MPNIKQAHKAKVAFKVFMHDLEHGAVWRRDDYVTRRTASFHDSDTDAIVIVSVYTYETIWTWEAQIFKNNQKYTAKGTSNHATWDDAAKEAYNTLVSKRWL